MTAPTLDQIITITGVNAKYWNPFEFTSAGEIPFSGYICRQESEKQGMLAVTALDGEEHLEFVYAISKIHYPYQVDRDGVARVVIPLPQNVMDARFNLKLDGTAIIFCPLKDAAGNVLEIIPCTRLQPVLKSSR